MARGWWLEARSRRRLWPAAAFALLATSVGLAWLVVAPAPRLPEPTGPHPVGTRTYVWTDRSRPEPFTADRGDRRQIVGQLWYPARGVGPAQPYIDNDATVAAIASRLGMPALLLRGLASAPTHAMADAEAAPGRFPVLLAPTGFSGFRNANLFWIEELASHGYVVVGLDQPGTAAATVLPDGRVILAVADKADFDRYMPLALERAPSDEVSMNGVPLPGGIVPFLAADLSFVLDELEAVDRADPVLAGRLDLGRAGVFGVSLGGYVGPEACRRDRRLRACLVADAGQTAAVAGGGLEQPVMIMSRDAEVMRAERTRAGGWPEAEIAHTVGSQRALFSRARGGAYYLTMNGMFHLNWTDLPA